MGKTRLIRKATAWVACVLLACSMVPAVAFATGGGDATLAAQGLSAAQQPGQSAQAVTPKDSLKDYTWTQLKKISNKIAAAKSNKEGLAIAKKYGLVNAKGKLTGATKTLKLADGTRASVRILGFRHDKLASGGLSGISFEFADIPVTYQMSSENSSVGGWKKSDMRSWLKSDFYNKLPSGLRERIVTVKKRTNNMGAVDDLEDTSVVSATKDKLWLLSSKEVYGEVTSIYGSDVPGSAIYNAEGKQYKLYEDKKVTVSNYSFCKKEGAYSSWWLRTPFVTASDYFLNTDPTGSRNSSNAAISSGVSPGFCF